VTVKMSNVHERMIAAPAARVGALPRPGPQRKRWVSWEGLRERVTGWTRPRALSTRQVSPRSRQPSSSQLRGNAWASAGAEAGKSRVRVVFRGCVSAAPLLAHRAGGGLFQASGADSSRGGGLGKLAVLTACRARATRFAVAQDARRDEHRLTTTRNPGNVGLDDCLS
jgi:hypothetical protein